MGVGPFSDLMGQAADRTTCSSPRERNGLTQLELADRASTSATYVPRPGRARRARRGLSILHRIATALDVLLSDLTPTPSAPTVLDVGRLSPEGRVLAARIVRELYQYEQSRAVAPTLAAEPRVEFVGDDGP